METEVITIDGPTSSGKNSVGFLLSQRLGYQYIDTGMIYRVGTYLVLKQNINLNDVLHTPEVAENVSTVSAIKEVREVTKVIQRKLGSSKDTVMTGRDIGSEIFPKAKHKFFLTAKVEVRAKRRFDQLIKTDPNIQYEIVLKSMEDRDRKDSTREVSPLRIPDKAIEIDNSDMSVEQTVEQMLKHIGPI